MDPGKPGAPDEQKTGTLHSTNLRLGVCVYGRKSKQYMGASSRINWAYRPNKPEPQGLYSWATTRADK